MRTALFQFKAYRHFSFKAIFLFGLLMNSFVFSRLSARNKPMLTDSLRSVLDTTQKPPNIIIILTDDMGYSDLSCYGGPYHTPNIDRLAKEGTMFTHYYSAAPICSPARVSILTGMEPSKWNITTFEQTMKGNRAANQAPYLDPDAPSIARVLKKAGYVTGHFGKWHMGGGRDVYFAPPFSAYGFDEYSSTYESPDPDPLLTANDWIWSPKDSIKRWERTSYFVDKTLDFLKRHKGQPCFVNLWPDDMHTPWVPNKELQDHHPDGAWQSENSFELVLKEYDKQIGRLLEGLQRLGVAKNTLVIFTSDNGPLPTFKGRRTGFKRGSKRSLYEGGTGLPFILRWPGHVEANQIDTISVISSLDIFPTLAAIVGAPMPPRFSFDGANKKEVWLNQPTLREKTIYWDYGSQGEKSAFNYPKGKDHSPNLAIRQGKWKLLINYNGSGMELYNIQNDPKETKNVAEEYKELAKKLKKQLIQWRSSMPELKEHRYVR